LNEFAKHHQLAAGVFQSKKRKKRNKKRSMLVLLLLLMLLRKTVVPLLGKRREVRHESASYGFMCRLEPRIAVRGTGLLSGSLGWLYPAVFLSFFVGGPAFKYHYNLLVDVSYTSDAGPFDSSKVQQLLPAQRKHTPI
jgi:hypothetical protein